MDFLDFKVKYVHQMLEYVELERKSLKDRFYLLNYGTKKCRETKKEYVIRDKAWKSIREALIQSITYYGKER